MIVWSKVVVQLWSLDYKLLLVFQSYNLEHLSMAKQSKWVQVESFLTKTDLVVNEREYITKGLLKV